MKNSSFVRALISSLWLTIIGSSLYSARTLGADLTLPGGGDVTIEFTSSQAAPPFIDPYAPPIAPPIDPNAPPIAPPIDPNAPPIMPIPKAPPLIVIPGTGASVLLDPGGAGNNGWPLDVLKTSIGNPEHLQFRETTGRPRRDTISFLLEPACCVVQGGSLVSILGSMPSLISFLEKEYKSVEKQRVFRFLHDFRFSVASNAEQLHEFIEGVKFITRSEVVDLVAHSRGGLVAKEYLNNHPENIRTLVMLGTPNLGVPKALKILRYGDNLGESTVDGCKVKRAAHNMPGILNMLPGRRLLAITGGYFWDEADIDGVGSRGLITDFEEMVFNLKYGKEHWCPLDRRHDVAPFDHLSARLLDSEFLRVHERRDNWQQPEGVNVFMIAGHNAFTMTGMVEHIITPEDVSLHPLPPLPPPFDFRPPSVGDHVLHLRQGNGDGTVPIESAGLVDATEIYFADMRALSANHDKMLAEPEVQQQVLGLLRFGRGIYGRFVTTEPPLPSLDRGALIISTASPVGLVGLRVFDSKGNHTGLLPDGSTEEGIPGSSFEQVEGQQFVTVPEGDTYEVVTLGMSDGDFILWQTDIDETGLPLRILEWDSVPVEPGSRNVLVTEFGAQDPELEVDPDDDSVRGFVVPVTSEFPGGGGPTLLADLNGDSQVNDADLAVVEASLGTTGDTLGYNPVADVNRDGIVDVSDLTWVSETIHDPNLP